MRKSKRFTKIISGALGLTFLASAAACNSANDPNSLKFFVWGTIEQVDMYTRMTEAFNASYGKKNGIDVSITAIDSGGYETTIKNKAGSRNGPDVFLVADASFKGWIRGYYFGEMQSYFDQVKDVDLGDIMPATYERLRYDIDTNTSNDDDPLYGLPLDSQPTALYYNQSLFKQADINVISVDEDKLEAWNNNEIADNNGNKKEDFPELWDKAGNKSKVDVPAKGYYRSKNPYYYNGTKTKPWVKPTAAEVLVFNNRIAMNWDEVEDLGYLFSGEWNPKAGQTGTGTPITEYGTTYGYFTEWWFNYGWSVGGDCLQDLTGEGDWNFSLLDPNPNYIVKPGKTWTSANGTVYEAGETLIFTDKMNMEEGEVLVPDAYGDYRHGSKDGELAGVRAEIIAEVAKEDGALAELPSTEEAFQRYLLLGAKKETKVDGLAGKNISPNPNVFTGTVTSMSYFWSGKLAVLANTSVYMHALADNAEEYGFEWDVAPLVVYKEYTDPADPDCDTVEVEGKDAGHSNTQTMVVRNKSQKKEAAAKFIMWMASPEGQKVRASLGFFPNQKSLIDDVVFEDGVAPNNVKVFTEALEFQGPGDWWYMPDHVWVEVWCVDLNSYVRNHLPANDPMTYDDWYSDAIVNTNEKLKEYKEFKRS